MTTVTTQWSRLNEMKMCYHYKGMTADFLYPTISDLPPSRLRKYSRHAVRAVGTTWPGTGCPTTKLSTRKQGFPNLITADFICSRLSELHPLEKTGERLWKPVSSWVTLFAPSLTSRGAEWKPHPGWRHLQVHPAWAGRQQAQLPAQ